MPEWQDPATWTDGEDLTATKFNLEIRDNITHLHDWLGELGYEEVVADSGGFTTVEVELLSLSVDIPVGERNIKLTGRTQIRSTVAGDVVAVRVKEGATILDEVRFVVGDVNTIEDIPKLLARLEAPAFGPHTYTLNAVRISGTGTITADASSESPTFLLAEAL